MKAQLAMNGAIPKRGLLRPYGLASAAAEPQSFANDAARRQRDSAPAWASIDYRTPLHSPDFVEVAGDPELPLQLRKPPLRYHPRRVTHKDFPCCTLMGFANDPVQFLL
ncbi:MAG: hypothetical protein HY066_05125 [Betaproteobacteria bacterium]|nr:hypothetical protein [Betaproteobacteria bacterium]